MMVWGSCSGSVLTLFFVSFMMNEIRKRVAILIITSNQGGGHKGDMRVERTELLRYY